jgi:sterol desaturase/sphingolipid hydroxylase (fatty acid hydroxylase superfamily)
VETLDTLLRASIEPIQYGVFFGLLFLFGAMEMYVQCSQDSAERRKRWPVNFSLTALNVLVLSVIPLTGVALADMVQDAGIGLFNLVQTNPLVAIASGILIRSFISWATHLAMHKAPLLWRVHRVHHTDTFLDISTTVRFHPMEFLIQLPILLLAVIVFGISPVTLMLYEVFDAGMNVFTHANIRLPRRLERALRRVIVTPDMHRIHHSSYQPETDSNYGATLSIWDHLFGTFRVKPNKALSSMELGLKEVQDRRALSFTWLLLLPFKPVRLDRLRLKQENRVTVGNVE